MGGNAFREGIWRLKLAEGILKQSFKRHEEEESKIMQGLAHSARPSGPRFWKDFERVLEGFLKTHIFDFPKVNSKLVSEGSKIAPRTQKT